MISILLYKYQSRNLLKHHQNSNSYIPEMRFWALTVLSLLLSLSLRVSSQTPQCGSKAENATCPNDLCCSSAGYCGSTDAYCCEGCQSQCHNCIITEEMFEEMLPNRNDDRCPGKGFYTYNAFINASKAYPEFGMTGDDDIKKRELAAFFGQTSQETSGNLWHTINETAYSLIDGITSPLI